jgi:hypothetical protein
VKVVVINSHVKSKSLCDAGNSILEVAVDPSYSIFFLEAWQKRLIWYLGLCLVAVGCILVLQAVRSPTKLDLPTSADPPLPYIKGQIGTIFTTS